jgi:HSP20 family molecular chaperone IbpA
MKANASSEIENVLKEGVKTFKETTSQLGGGQWKEDAATKKATLSLELPGVKTPEITIVDEKRLIKVRGVRNDTEVTVEKAVSIPANVNLSTIRAHMADGILHLTASISIEGRVLELDSEPDYQTL